MKDLGATAFRFSFEWARLEPHASGELDPEAVEKWVTHEQRPGWCGIWVLPLPACLMPELAMLLPQVQEDPRLHPGARLGAHGHAAPLHPPPVV